MNTSNDVRVASRDNVLWITLDRPAAMNALSAAMLTKLAAAIDTAAKSDAIGCVVITGSGRAFCAGADLKEVHRGGSVAPEDLLTFLALAAGTLKAIEDLPKPVIAAVNGMALAGGLELVLCCDLVIAARSAKFGDAHANHGLLPGAGSSIRLPRKIGPTHAKYLLMTGQTLAADDPMLAALINQIVPDEQLPEVVERLAATLTGKSQLVLRRMKALVDDGLDQPVDTGLRLERAACEAHVFSADMHEGLAAFNERRPPRFIGR